MIATLAPVAALFMSMILLLMGNGLQGMLVPVRANIENFGFSEIGFIGTSYYIGFGLGCYFGGRIVRRAGHIRTFSAMASLASAVAIVHAIFITPVLWWGLRAMTGFCFAVLYVVIESWLNERATNENRGLILSIYNMINLVMITVGQMMLTLSDPASFPLFTLASVLVSLAVIPIAMTRAPSPAPVENVHLRLGYLYRVSPVGWAGAFAVGLSLGSFWALGPVFAQERGFGVTGIALFMSAAVLAGAIGQWPLGRLSDRVDRRLVIAGACVIAAAGSVASMNFVSLPMSVTFAFAAVFGAAAFPLYSICLAHMNDYVQHDEFVEASSTMLLLFAVGAAIGALPASALMTWMGRGGLFAFIAVVHLGLGAFTMTRVVRREAPAPEEKEPFVATPRTSPTLFALDPRSDETEAEDTAPGETVSSESR